MENILAKISEGHLGNFVCVSVFNKLQNLHILWKTLVTFGICFILKFLLFLIVLLWFVLFLSFCYLNNIFPCFSLLYLFYSFSNLQRVAAASSSMWPLLLDLSRDESKRILRRLELEAYSSLITAFRAQGILTKYKKKLLQELQHALR